MSSAFHPESHASVGPLFPEREFSALAIPADIGALLEAIAEAVLLVEGERIVYANGAGRRLLKLNEDGSLRSPPLTEVLNSLESGSGWEVVSRPWPRQEAPSSPSLQVVTLRRGSQSQGFPQCQLDREREQLIYGIAHDLKTPVQGITHLVSWILEDAGDRLPEESLYHLQLLRRRVHRLESLLNGLLGYLKIGRGVETPQGVNLRALVQQVVTQLNPAPGYTLQVESECDEIFTERSLLQQVLTHLLENALKHHHRPQGHIKITVQDQGQEYQFAVQDDGPGIAPDYHDKIFLLFQTLRPRDELETIGLGLAVVKKIVEAKGGRLILQSKVGEGSCFQFSWPKSSPGA